MKHYFKVITAISIGFILGFTSPAHNAPLMLEVIEGKPELSLFRQAIEYGRANAVFKGTTGPDTPAPIAAVLPFTLFLPNNEAMKKAGWTAEKMEEVAKNEGYFGEGFDPNNPRHQSTTLRTFVKQHVCMKFKHKKAQLKPEYERFEGDKLSIKNGKISGETGGKPKSASIVTPDLDANSGIIHIIDGVLGFTPEEAKEE